MEMSVRYKLKQEGNKRESKSFQNKETIWMKRMPERMPGRRPKADNGEKWSKDRPWSSGPLLDTAR